MTQTVLLVEDSAPQRAHYAAILEGAGYDVIEADCAASGFDSFVRNTPNVVALDLMLPDRDGLNLMRDCLAMAPHVPFVVLTAHGTIKSSVEAMRSGACDFLPKPFNDVQLVEAIALAKPTVRPVQPLRNVRPVDPLSAEPLDGFIGASAAMLELWRQLRAVGSTTVPVFLTGPSGSGRGSCARALHRLTRKDEADIRPFVALHASALSPEAQIAAITGDKGLLSRASGGTAYIADPCTLSDVAQSALLEQLFDLDGRDLDIQLVTSATRDPFIEVRTGQLREDLFHRLYVAPIKIPALKDRGEDVVAIANAIIQGVDARQNHGFVGLDADVAAFFRRYDWPGNVRQLKNVIRSTLLLHTGPLITMSMLPIELTTAPEANTTTVPLGSLVGRSLSAIEEIVIEETIRKEAGSIPRAARVLDVSPSTLYRKREAWAKRGVS